MTVSNMKEFFRDLDGAKATIKKRHLYRITMAIHIMHEAVEERTPVWSGSAVANYKWSVGSPDYTYVEPYDNGDPGPTNSMALGTEPRRPPNAEIAVMSMHDMPIGNGFGRYYLNNNDPDIEGLEMGQLPPAPLVSRSPFGMVNLSLSFVHMMLESSW